MSFNAFAIMLKPFIAGYLAPLEENGTIAKLQADIELVAKSGAIPELAKLVHGLERHNALLEQLVSMIAYQQEGKAAHDDSRTSTPEFGANPFAGPDTGTAGPIGHSGNGMLELPKPD